MVLDRLKSHVLRDRRAAMSHQRDYRVATPTHRRPVYLLVRHRRVWVRHGQMIDFHKMALTIVLQLFSTLPLSHFPDQVLYVKTGWTLWIYPAMPSFVPQMWTVQVQVQLNHLKLWQRFTKTGRTRLIQSARHFLVRTILQRWTVLLLIKNLSRWAED